MKLFEIQQKLQAPKGQYNDFGKYKYRSCEDILEALKPLLEFPIIISDEVVNIGERYYVKATAEYGDTKVTAYAREADSKKGMDAAQITGAALSYARKYALNGLFAIDDTRDADTHDNTKPAQTPTPTKKAPAKTANSSTACPECHAPGGKPHASSCSLK